MRDISHGELRRTMRLCKSCVAAFGSPREYSLTPAMRRLRGEAEAKPLQGDRKTEGIAMTALKGSRHRAGQRRHQGERIGYMAEVEPKMGGKHISNCACPQCNEFGGKHLAHCVCPYCGKLGGEHSSDCKCPQCFNHGGNHASNCRCPICGEVG